MQKIKAPLSVRIISWYFIIGSAISLLVMPFMLNNAQFRDAYHALNASPEAAVAVSVVGAIICLTAGIAMLRRRAWARVLILVYLPATLVYTLWMYNFVLQLVTILPVIICVLVFFFLTRRKVSIFFSDNPEIETAVEASVRTQPPPPENPLWRRILGVVLLVLAGFFLYLVSMSVASLPALSAASWRVFTWFGLPALAFLLAGNWLRSIRRWKTPTGVVFISCGGLLLLIGSALLWQNPLPAKDNQSVQTITVDSAQLKRTGLRLSVASIPIALLGVGLIIWQRKEDK